MTLPQALAPHVASPPKRKAPEGAVDAHVHMLAAPGEFALYEGRVEDPAAGVDFQGYLEKLKEQMATLGCSRTVIVQSIFYGADNSVTEAAVAALGDAARGIGLVTDAASDAELDRLVAARLMGVRLNYVHGGVLSWKGVKAMAPRLADRGLHVQMLLNAHRHMEELAGEMAEIHVPVVLDHIGWPDLTAGVAEPGFQTLLGLVSEGHVWVKLSGIYRLSDAPYEAADAHVKALLAANPERCLWGSDWPHIMLADAAQPDSGMLLDAFDRICPNDEVRHQVLVDTPAQLYGF